MSIISIVIRTYNEEQWIRHCLLSVFSQDFKDIEVIIVDNNSTDKTLSIVNEFPIKKIIKIENYLPGLALNMGVLANKAEYYVFLSAHCIPCEKTWLTNLFKQINQNELIVGVYGRQVPLPSSEDIDKRDLLMTFSCESRISKLDGFFHNANSMVKASYFNKNLFDPSVTNAEDHIWGRKAIEAGFQIAYSSESTVFHHHGLHQGSPPKRVSGVVRQLEKNIKENEFSMPQSLTIEGAKIYTVVVIPNYLEKQTDALVSEYLKIFKKIESLKKIFFIIPNFQKFIPFYVESSKDFIFLDRKAFTTSLEEDLRILLQEVLIHIEKNYSIPDHILYLNASYIKNKNSLVDLIKTHLFTNSSTTLIGQKTYECIWASNEEKGYRPVTADLLRPKKIRKPLFKVFYGLGSIYLTRDLREKNMTNQVTGIFEIDEEIKISRLK